MDFLSQQNKRNNNEEVTDLDILAKNKHVVVIGGGDTGSDCVGTSIRQNAASVTQIEIMPKPPEDRTDSTPWPLWPYQLRTSSSHKEGCKRSWNVMTKNFEEENGKIKKINAVKVEWEMSDEGMPVKFKEVPGSEFSLDADLVFLSMGFTGPEKSPILSQFDLEYDSKGNIKTDDKGKTKHDKVFAAGDVVSGASLVVRALAAGKELAESIDEFLK